MCIYVLKIWFCIANGQISPFFVICLPHDSSGNFVSRFIFFGERKHSDSFVGYLIDFIALVHLVIVYMQGFHCALTESFGTVECMNGVLMRG